MSSGNPYAITASGAVDSDYSISYVAGILTVSRAALTITADNQTKVYGAALPTLTAVVRGLRQWRHLRQPDHPAHAEHHGHRRQPCRRAARTRSPPRERSTVDYTISYATGNLTVTPAASDDHGRQPDQGLRRGVADPDGQLHRASSMATPLPA